MRSRCRLGVLTLVAAGALVLASATAFAQGGSQSNYDPLQITCAGVQDNGKNFIDLRVKAGPTGAPAGFSLQWMSVTDYEANGGWYSSDDPKLCKMSFSGQPSYSGNAGPTRWELGTNGEVTIRLSDALFDETGVSGSLGPDLFEGTCGFLCGAEYYFRAFAHGSRYSGRSCYSWAGVGSPSMTPGDCPSGPASTSDNGNPAAAELTEPGVACATSTDCGGCTFTQGYWKTHGPTGCVKGGNTNVWCVTSLTLGSISYTDLQLCSILNAPAKGNGLLILAHQLIAAKLNSACGGATCDDATDIAAADAFIGNKVIPPVSGGTSVTPGALPTGLVTALDNFNNGIGCANHCAGSQLAGPNRAHGIGKSVRWGQLKVRYR